MITITTTHGEYRGRTIDSIVRREYGRTAKAVRSGDPNAPEWGMVVHTDKHGTHVLAQIAGRAPGIDHGTEMAYRLGCRCPDCRGAHHRPAGPP